MPNLGEPAASADAEMAKVLWVVFSKQRTNKSKRFFLKKEAKTFLLLGSGLTGPGAALRGVRIAERTPI
jgi:hypothetical protein